MTETDSLKVAPSSQSQLTEALMTEATNLQQLGTSHVDLAKIDSMLNELAASADARFGEYVPDEPSAFSSYRMSSLERRLS